MGIHKRIANWARCYKPTHPIKTCGSAEKNYKSPWRQWIPLCEIPLTTPPDPLDADAVEKAWRNIPVRRYRQILKLSHMTDLPEVAIAYKAGTKVWRLKADYANAVSALTQNLQNVL